jgi:hypothetical protein
MALTSSQYIERLEQIINDLHHELELTTYSAYDISAANDISRTADRLWNEFYEAKSQHEITEELSLSMTQEQA